jgi:hypothetical protein
VASEPSDVLGLIWKVVVSPGWSQTTTQLLMEGENGIAPRLWDKVLSAAGPPPHGLVVSPSGRKLLGLVSSTGTDVWRAGAVERLVLVDITTAQPIETGFEQSRSAGRRLNYAVSADGQALAVGLSVYTSGGADLTLTVLRGPDLHPSVQRTFPGHAMVITVIDHLLQWSPDDRYLALQMGGPSDWRDSVHILDAQSLETVHSTRKTGLMGSQSWSPDGTKLAVLEYDEPRILHLDDQRLEPLPWLRGERGDPPRQPQILGLLGNDHALVLRQTRARARLIVADLATGDGPTAAAIPITDMDRPVRLTISRAWEHIADVG